MRVFLHSIGCRLNQSEIETMAWQLIAGGHEIVDNPAEADKVVINTCAVTREAAKDARKITRHIHRENENAEIYLTGCYATVAPQELAELNGASRIVGNQEKDRMILLLDPKVSIEQPVYEQEPILRGYLAGNTGNTRAFVKVQDGCDNRCTFCITTIARGDGRSKRVGDVVDEIQALASAGYKEVVLTGVHLGSYGRDIGHEANLGGLLMAILQHTDIPRLRLSSLEPWDIEPAFFELWRNPRLLPHLHVPLQSGSDKILRRMARRTNQASFRELVVYARNAIPDLSLTTDLIVGFPGETDDDFRESFDFVAEAGFSRLHVFTYSRRPGTAAAEMAGQLPKAVKKERSQRMIMLGHDLSLAFHKHHEGKESKVLWEMTSGANEQGLRWLGYTENYIRVSANGPSDLFNRISTVRLSAARPDGMSGTILTNHLQELAL